MTPLGMPVSASPSTEVRFEVRADYRPAGDNMLKNTLAAAMALTMLAALPVQAEDIQSTTQDERAQSALNYLHFASVTEPGELIEAGDLIKIQRIFSSWTLRCDIRLSKNRRVCFVEQRGEANGAALVWRVGMNTDNKPIVVIALPADFDADKGLRMKFSELEKKIGKEHFACSPQSCIGGFLFEGFVQAAISKTPDFGFEVPRVNAEPVSLQFSMIGFTDALDAAARDPFGRDVSAKVARQIPSKVGGKMPLAKRLTKPKMRNKTSDSPRKKVADNTAGQTSGVLY